MKQIWKLVLNKSLIILCGILCVQTSAQVIHRLYSVEKILEIRQSAIFKIISYKDGKQFSHGTGFFIKPDGTALTNFHVLFHSEENLYASDGYHYNDLKMNKLLKLSKFKYRFIDQNGKDLGAPNIIGCGNKNNLDACMLKFNSEKKFSYIPLSEEKIGKGHKVLSLGHCGGKLNTKNGTIREYHTDFLGKFNIASLNLNRNTKMIDITNPICPGDSGGPIFSSTGQLVGMTSIRFKGQGKQFFLGILIDETKSIQATTPFNLVRYVPPAKTQKIRRPANPFEIR